MIRESRRGGKKRGKEKKRQRGVMGNEKNKSPGTLSFVPRVVVGSNSKSLSHSLTREKKCQIIV